MYIVLSDSSKVTSTKEIYLFKLYGEDKINIAIPSNIQSFNMSNMFGALSTENKRLFRIIEEDELFDYIEQPTFFINVDGDSFTVSKYASINSDLDLEDFIFHKDMEEPSEKRQASM